MKIQRFTHALSSRGGRLALASVLGMINTLMLFGREPINPTNISWIFGDNATYYAGWALFRHDTHLSFPLAWTDRVGYPVGTSIAMLDAIPLVAILLRPLSSMLSEPFQYLGLYSAVCFILQAYFGLSLCRRLFPASPLFVLLGSLFLLLSAPLTWRAFGHTALLSHWLILAELDSYVRDPGDHPLRWMARLWIVLGLAAAITPYIAVMCLLLTLAGLGRLVLERRVGWRQGLGLVATTIGVLFACSATFGVLVTRDAQAFWAPGYGLFSFNLDSPLNPMDYGSLLLPRLPVIDPAQVEGYSYLGLGILVLLIAGTIRRPSSVLWLGQRRWLPLVALAMCCTVLAASTTVTFGSLTLFTYDAPQQIATILNGLRASGRLFWPAYYVIVLSALSLTFWTWTPRYRVAILAGALALQMADLTPLRNKVRATVDQRFRNPLNDSAWTGLGRTHDNLILVPPYQCDPYSGAGGYYSYVTFGQAAAAEHMRTNSYYAARYTRQELAAHCVDLLRDQLDGKLDLRSAYVVTEDVRTLWSINGLRSHSCRYVDGYNLCTALAPGGTPPPAAPISKASPYTIDERINFKTGGNAGPYQSVGWQAPTPDGTWTKGPIATLRLGVETAVDPARSLLLQVDATPFAIQQHPRLYVEVVVNGRVVDQWLFRFALTSARRQARIPAALIGGRHELDVEFRFGNPAAPLYLGVGPSSSFLGLQMHGLVVRYE